MMGKLLLLSQSLPVAILVSLLFLCLQPEPAQGEQSSPEQTGDFLALSYRNSAGVSAKIFGGKQHPLLKSTRLAKVSAAVDFKNRSEFTLRVFSEDQGLSVVADNVLRADRSWLESFASNENLAQGSSEEEGQKKSFVLKDDWQLLSLEDFLRLRPNENLSIDVGKKLTRWGVATLYNPIELLNEGKDLINPAQEDRQGNWQASAEMVTERVTASVLGALEMRSSKNGIPEAFNSAHHAFGLRLFTSLEETDITGVVYYTQKYQSSFEHKPWLGFAFSRMLTASTETHIEALFFEGSDRLQVNRECTESQESFALCVKTAKAVTRAKRLESKNFNTRLIAGTRTQFSNDSLLSVEVLFLSDGDTQTEFNARLKLLEILKDAPASLDFQQEEAQSYSFKRKWYSAVQYQNLKINDDLNCSLPVLVNLEDFSAAISPRINYTPEQWLTLSLYLTAFLDSTGQSRSEFSLTQNSVVSGVEARAHF